MRVILCGFGVVGQSLVSILESRAENLYSAFGLKPRIVGVADTGGGVCEPSGLDTAALIGAKKQRGSVSGYASGRSGMTGAEIIEECEADVMVETTSSNYRDAEPGMSHITSAMRHGMHVISVNKGPLALAFPSLVELARYNNVSLRFSGTVGGGTPILDYAKNSLRGERIESFRGILNGTTNYILTNMANKMSFDDALDDARSKGYVEADESLDLDGLDAAAKLVILANWVMGMKVTMPDIKCVGIRGIRTADIRRAASKECAVKLIASCDGELKVSPQDVRTDDPLCVNGTLNGISFVSAHSGTQTIIGRGAGGIETASSIIRDMIDIRGDMAVQ